jgi:hypothetical protein
MKGKTHTKETIEKILNTKKGRVYSKIARVVSEETKQKLRAINLGKKQSEETKQKKREISLKNGNKPPVRISTEESRKRWSEMNKGEKNGNYGKGMKPHVKEILIKINTGSKQSEETKLKLSLARRGKPKSEEWKMALRKPKTKYMKNGTDRLKKNKLKNLDFSDKAV